MISIVMITSINSSKPLSCLYGAKTVAMFKGITQKVNTKVKAIINSQKTLKGEFIFIRHLYLN